MKHSEAVAVEELKHWLRYEKIFIEPDIEDMVATVYEASKYTGMSVEDVCSFVPIALAGTSKRFPVSAKTAGDSMRSIIHKIGGGE